MSRFKLSGRLPALQRRRALVLGALVAAGVLLPAGVALLGPDRAALATLLALALGIAAVGGILLAAALGVLPLLLAPLTRRASVLEYAVAGALYVALPLAALLGWRAWRTGGPLAPGVRLVLGLAAIGALLGAIMGAIERHIARQARDHDAAV